MSNVDRLADAGILNVPVGGLTQEQTEAIESLTEEEVDVLISAQNKLYPAITDEDEIFAYPGIPETPSQTP